MGIPADMVQTARAIAASSAGQTARSRGPTGTWTRGTTWSARWHCPPAAWAGRPGWPTSGWRLSSGPTGHGRASYGGQPRRGSRPRRQSRIMLPMWRSACGTSSSSPGTSDSRCGCGLAVWTATEWVIALQTPRGEVAWERDAAGRPGEFALLSGCASILQGLRCAIALAEISPQARSRTGSWPPGSWATSWPAIPRRSRTRASSQWTGTTRSFGGALRGAAAAARIGGGLGRVRRPWPSACAASSDQALGDGSRDMRTGHVTGRACGRAAEARGRLRHRVRGCGIADGSYWTGWQYVNENHFPDERSSWTAAAVILAADALQGFSRRRGDLP